MGIADKIEYEFDSLKHEINKLKKENYELTKMMFNIAYKLCQYDVESVKTNFPELTDKLFNMRVEYLKTTYVNAFYYYTCDNTDQMIDVFDNYKKQYSCKQGEKYNKSLEKITEIKDRIESLLKENPVIESDEFRSSWRKLIKEGKFAIDAYTWFDRIKIDESNCLILPF